MSILNASIFGVVATLIVGGADYAMTMKKHVGQEYGLLDHFEYRFSDAMTGNTVAKALPLAPTGWEVRKAVRDDSLRMTGLQVDGASVAAMTAQNDQRLQAVAGLQTEGRLYQKGDAAVFLNISFVPAIMADMPEVKEMAQAFLALDGAATDVADHATGTMALRKYSGPEYGKSVMYYAVPDGQIFISALSTASEAETLGVLAGIDLGALGMLVVDDPSIADAAAAAIAEDAAEAPVACVQKGAAKFCSANN